MWRYGPPVTEPGVPPRGARPAPIVVRGSGMDQSVSATEPAASATSRTATPARIGIGASSRGEPRGRRTLQTVAKPTPWRTRPTVPIGSRVRSADGGDRLRRTNTAAKANQAARIATKVHSWSRATSTSGSLPRPAPTQERDLRRRAAPAWSGPSCSNWPGDRTRCVGRTARSHERNPIALPACSRRGGALVVAGRSRAEGQRPPGARDFDFEVGSWSGAPPDAEEAS